MAAQAEVKLMPKKKGSKKKPMKRPKYLTDPRLMAALQRVGVGRRWLGDQTPRLLEAGAGLLVLSIFMMLISPFGKPVFWMGWLVVAVDLILHPPITLTKG